MHYSMNSFLLHATTALSVAVPLRQANSTSSPSFIIQSRLSNSTNITSPYSSLGYLHAEYAYPPGYYATLHTARSDAITGYLSDTSNASDSSLIFPEGDGYYQGFVLAPLSQAFPTSIAQIYSGQNGTDGVSIDALGRLQYQDANGPVAWYACPKWALEWGPATAVGYKWTNASTPTKCYDIDLIVEYN